MKFFAILTAFAAISLHAWSDCSPALSSKLRVSADILSHHVVDSSGETWRYSVKGFGLFAYDHVLTDKTDSVVLTFGPTWEDAIFSQTTHYRVLNCDHQLIGKIEATVIPKFLFNLIRYNIYDAKGVLLASALQDINPGVGNPSFVFVNAAGKVVGKLTNGVSHSFFGKVMNPYEVLVESLGVPTELLLPLGSKMIQDYVNSQDN